MLTFDDDLAVPAAKPPLPAATPETIRAQATGGILSREPVHDLDAEAQALANGFHRVRLEDKRVINGQRIYPPLTRNRREILDAAAPVVQTPPQIFH